MLSPIDVGHPNKGGVKRIHFCEAPLPPAASLLEVSGFHKTRSELTDSFQYMLVMLTLEGKF